HAHNQAVLPRIQGADAVRERLGKHGHGAIGKIGGSASQTRLAVERRIPPDVMGHVGNMDLKMPAFRTPFDVNSVVEIARRFAVNGYDRQMTKIPAPLTFGGPHRPRYLVGLLDY